MTGPRPHDLEIERDGGIVVVTLNRPHRRNALSVAMIDELGRVFDELADFDSGGDEVGAVLVHGAEQFFCSGLDVKDLALTDAPREAWARVHLALARIEVPVVAAVAGGAVNAGAALALGCDLLVSGENAYVQIMEASLGVSAPLNAAWLAERHTPAVGLQMVLSGRRFVGPELLRLGVAFEVVPDADVETRGRELCHQLAGYPNRGAALVKQSLLRAAATGGPFAARVAAALAAAPRTPVAVNGRTR